MKENPLGWLFSCVSIVCYFIIFYNSKVYANAGLQLFFLIVSVNGFLNWTAKNQNGYILVVTNSTTQQLMVSLFSFCFIFGVLVGLLKQYTNSDVPVLDAFTTALSIVAQVLLSKKKLENWLIWIVVNVISVGLYFYKGLYLTTLLYSIFAILAILGYIEWRKKVVKV